MHRIFPVLLAGFALSATLAAQAHKDVGDDKRGYTDTPQLPNQPWKVHDAARPRPPKVKPGEPLLNEAPPGDAIVLFDGKDLSQWISMGRDGKAHEPQWKVENGYMEITPHSGALVTKEKFGDCQLHVEWMIPQGVEGAGQSRGNSGVEIMRRYEIQVLESYTNVTYADGQAGSIYGQWPPLVNASRPQGEWNVYDIYFEAPRFEGEKLLKPGYVTIVHNGILVQHHQEIIGKVIHRKVATYQPHGPEEPLSLQDHNQVARYRNIWIRRLKGYDQQ
jgi:3-keto-disaccharide hydrolase